MRRFRPLVCRGRLLAFDAWEFVTSQVLGEIVIVEIADLLLACVQGWFEALGPVRTKDGPHANTAEALECHGWAAAASRLRSRNGFLIFNSRFDAT